MKIKLNRRMSVEEVVLVMLKVQADNSCTYYFNYRDPKSFDGEVWCGDEISVNFDSLDPFFSEFKDHKSYAKEFKKASGTIKKFFPGAVIYQLL
jgi:hypothetical protein